MSNFKEALLKQFDELADNLEPEIYAEAHQGDIDWKPFRKFLSKALDQVKKDTERETLEFIRDNSSGGGSWRRVIEMKLSSLKSEVVKPNDEIPTQYLLDSLQESEKDYKAGRYKSFATGKDALDYLDAKKQDEKR